MKRIIFGIFILWAAIACKPSSERNDEKYLGTWKENIDKFGNCNGVKITLNGRDDYPYDITSFNSTPRNNFDIISQRAFKISGNSLIGETMVYGTLPTFNIIDEDQTFHYGRFSGPTKNHTK